MVSRSSLYSGLGPSLLLMPAVRTADVNSASLDTRDCESAAILFVVGDSADTLSGSVKVELEVQESDDNTTFTAVANSDLNNYVAGTNVGTGAVIDAPAEDQVALLVGYKGYKRYIRGVANLTGTHTSGTIIGVIGLRGNNHYQPMNANT